MYLLGHTATGVLLGLGFNKLYKEESHMSLLIGAFAVMIPDLIDKPIGSLFFNSGRWFGHSLLFINSFGLLLVLTRKAWMEWFANRGMDLPSFSAQLIWAGMYLHLLGDMPTISHVVMLWPLFGPFPVGHREDFLLGLLSTTTKIGETAGLVFHIGNGLRLRWNFHQWSYFVFFLATYVIAIAIAWLLLVD